MKLSMILLAVILPMQLFSQAKVEREFRIDPDAAPTVATQWINSTFSDTKRGFKWFFEISGEEKSYEAKFRWQGSRYSIKFDTLGVLLDVEYEINRLEIANAVRNKIEKNLSDTFISHNILRVQRQLIGSPEAIYSYITQDNEKGITINYEMEIRGRKETQNELWEVLFNSAGDILEIQIVKLHPPTNLDF